MRIFSKVCIFCLLLLLSLFQTIPFLYSQTHKIIFQHITNKNGLSQNSVSSIFRDKRGLMWFASLNGLNCYDGRNFVIYRNDSSNNSISSNLVNYICDDQNGNLWIATKNGLNKFIFDENRFVRYYHEPSNNNSISDNYIRFVYRDKQNNIWICTNSQGLDKLTFVNNKPCFKHYPFLEGNKLSVSAGRVNCVTEDHEGYIWIGTADGLDKLNPKIDEIKSFKNDPHNPNSLSNNSVNAIYESKNHLLWVGTKLGLNKTDFENNKNTIFYENLNNAYSLGSSAIRFITEDLNNEILIGTLNGLFKYNASNNNFYQYEFNPNEEYSLNNNFISHILCDPNGNVWVGTEKGGVNKFRTNQQKFENFISMPNNNAYLNTNIVNSIYDEGDYIWFGTAGGGLNRYNKKTRLFNYYTAQPSKPGSISHNFISAITKDSYGSLWFATWGLGLNKLSDPANVYFKKYSFSSSATDSLNWNLVSCILEFPKGNLWIGSRLGLSRMDIKSGNIYLFGKEKTSDIAIIRISCLMKDNANNLWIGTDEGLFRMKWNNIRTANLNRPDSVFRYENNPDNSFSVACNHITSMLEDKNGNIWISAYGFGLEKVNPKEICGKNVKFHLINKTNQSLDNYIYCILDDQKGNLWLSTENGIQKYNPQKNSCQTFYESDGIQGNQFYWSSCFKNSSGKLYFGGLKGLTCFWPDSIVENKPIEKVIFTDFKIFNKSVPVNKKDKDALHQHISNLNSVKIRYKQNVFTIEFTGLNYDINPNIQYAYKLENFDENWIYTDNNRPFATYTNLSPGTYYFKVKAANRDGIWNNNETTMMVTIQPAWWQTLMFKIAVLLIFSLTILLAYYRHIYNLKGQHRKLEQMVEQRTEMLNQQNLEVQSQKNEILAQKDEILAQKNEIAFQNRQLQLYGNHLEDMVKDRTRDLELAKNKAEEADRLKSSFLSNLSHEIRTPMNAIIGFTGLIANGNFEKDPVNEWSKIVMQNGETLLHVIDDIIDFAKIETSQISINKKWFKTYNLVNEIYETYQIKAEQKIIDLKPNVQLVLSIAPEHKNFISYSDPARITQIFGNLINNAIKFTEKGYIEIGFKPNDEEILFWVKDTGIGIDPKNHEVIFDRFRKIEENINQIYRGTGLGLALVKKLTELLGGKIWVESKIDIGSTFYFTLSAKTTDNTQSEFGIKKENIQILDNLSGCNILVAEDEEANFMYIKTILLKEKANIIRANNGKEAIVLCNNTDKIDIILMDIKMPIMNGIDATREIKKSFPHIPVFAVTAYALADEKEAILKEEFSEYLTKPINKNLLINTIKKYYTV